MEKLPPELSAIREQAQRRIRQFSRVRRGVRNAGVAYRLGAQALWVGVGALLLLSGRVANLAVNLALFAAAALWLVALPVRALRRWERFRGVLSEAFRMEALAGNLNSRLISALDFLARGEVGPLARVVIDRAAQDLRSAFENLLDRRELARFRRRFALVLLLFLTLGFTPWFGFRALTANATHCWFSLKELLFPTRYVLTPAAGRHVYQIGQQVTLRLQLDRRECREVTLVGTPLEGAPTRELLPVAADGAAQRVFRGDVESEFRLHFEIGTRQTEAVTLIFTTRPVLENMQTEQVYPAYTRLVPRDLEGIQTRLVGLPGTRLTLGLTFSKPLESATLTWEDGETLPLDVAGRFASVGLVHTQPRQGTIQVRDLHGFNLEHPHPLELQILEDERPVLFLPRHLKPEMPSLADELKLFSIGARVQDDYGVARCVFKWTKATLENRSAVLEKGEVERLLVPPLPKSLVEFKGVFGALSVKPGDLIGFQVEAYDNRQPENQRVASATFSFFIYQGGLENQRFAEEDAFGGLQFGRAGRIGRVKMSNEVVPTQPLKTTERYVNEYDAAVRSDARPPSAKGDRGPSVERYFKILSGAEFREGDP